MVANNLSTRCRRKFFAYYLGILPVKLIILYSCFVGLQNPIDTIYHLQPVMALGLLPLAFVIEGKSFVT